MNLLDAALLGIVQGLTEFLPVSSSGHLILSRAFFGWDAGRYGLAFDVACHVGTLVAIVAYFHRDLVAMARGALGALTLTFRDGEAERLIRLIAVGTLPVVVVALVFGDALEESRDPKIVAVALAVGGVGLLLAERLGTHSRDENTIAYWEALALGAAQAAALVPGVGAKHSLAVFAIYRVALAAVAAVWLMS